MASWRADCQGLCLLLDLKQLDVEVEGLAGQAVVRVELDDVVLGGDDRQRTLAHLAGDDGVRLADVDDDGGEVLVLHAHEGGLAVLGRLDGHHDRLVVLVVEVEMLAELDLEHVLGVGHAVGVLGLDVDVDDITYLHVLDRAVKAGNHLALHAGELDRLVALARAVEHLAVVERADVVDLDLLALVAPGFPFPVCSC